MSILNNKYNLGGQKLDARIYNGYVYDITPSKISNKMIDLLYSNTLVQDGLVVDVSPITQQINFVKNPNVIPYGLMDNLISGTTTNYTYIFKNRNHKIYDNPTIDGWTIETIINFNNLPSTPFNPFFYIGVINVGKENKVISGETTNNSDIGLSDFLSNNLTFSFDNRRSIEIRSIKYINECFDCDEKEITLDEFFNVPKNVESNSMLLDSSLTSGCPEDTIFIDDNEPVTGSTYYIHNFNKSISLSNEEDFHLTITYEREKTPNIHNCSELNQKFIDSTQDRLGVLRIYVNCVLYGVLYDFEDIIPRGSTQPDSIPYVHSWGVTDDSPLFKDFSINGEFSGIIRQGLFYIRPLTIGEICNNFNVFKNNYNMSDIRLSNCFVNLPKQQPMSSTSNLNDDRVITGDYQNNTLTLTTLLGDVINIPLNDVADRLIGNVEIIDNFLIFKNINNTEIIRVDLRQYTDPLRAQTSLSGTTVSGVTDNDVVTETELKDRINNEFSTYLDNNLNNLL